MLNRLFVYQGLLLVTALALQGCDGDGVDIDIGDDIDAGDDAAENDGDTEAGDAGDGSTPLMPLKLVGGGNVLGAHTCALFPNGDLRCWGTNTAGQLGYGYLDAVGDDEPASAGGVVQLGGKAIQIAAGGIHNCAIMEDGTVRCWGANASGQLGYGHTNKIGDTELPNTETALTFPSKAVRIAAGFVHTCVVLETGDVQCWGANTYGEIGHPEIDSALAAPNVLKNLGDDETVVDYPLVDLGAGVKAVDVACGNGHTCILTDQGQVKCWGDDTFGQLGNGTPTQNVGYDDFPADIGMVPLVTDSVKVIQLVSNAAADFTCVLFEDQTVQCWGYGLSGQLGTGQALSEGGEFPASDGILAEIGGSAVDLTIGESHTCAVMSNSDLRCWGGNSSGQLGRGDTEMVGNDELPSDEDPVAMGNSVLSVGAGNFHTCAVVTGDQVYCWGTNANGELGYGDTATNPAYGNEAGETPVNKGPVTLQ